MAGERHKDLMLILVVSHSVAVKARTALRGQAHLFPAGHSIYGFFTFNAANAYRAVTGFRIRHRPRPLISGRFCMFDVLILVLGTGGILLMAAYAALCERI